MTPPRIFYVTVSLSILLAAVKPESLQSQQITYFNYLNYTSEWYYLTYWSYINQNWGYNYEFYYIDGDTIIDSDAYYKIMKLLVHEVRSPVYSRSESIQYAYALREDADSLFTYKYPDGTQKVYSNKPSAWTDGRITFFGGEIPHRIYWKYQSPTQGWVEGIGWGQIGGTFPGESGSHVLQCYKRDTLSTDTYGNSCEFNYAVTAVEESNTLETISIFPNPASTDIYFSGLDEKIEIIRIFSINGVLIKAIHAVEGNAPIDVSSYNPGMYFILLCSGDKNYVARFLIAE